MTNQIKFKEIEKLQQVKESKDDTPPPTDDKREDFSSRQINWFDLID